MRGHQEDSDPLDGGSLSLASEPIQIFNDGDQGGYNAVGWDDPVLWYPEFAVAVFDKVATSVAQQVPPAMNSGATLSLCRSP